MKRLAYLSLFFILFSCSVQHHFVYETYIPKSKDKSLTYSDSILSFSFSPKPNGIYFNIKNLTDANIFLIWDGTYFVEPNGNTSKALNTDVLDTDNKISAKENYESIIPKQGLFARFTTSAKNLSIFSQTNVNSYYNNLSRQFSQETVYSEMFLNQPYWITSEKSSIGSKKEVESIYNGLTKKLSKYVDSNNNLGLGFTFRIGDETVEYDFKFMIKNIKVFRRFNGDYGYSKVGEINISD